MTHADSAGTPWEGRAFETNPNAGDDGSAPEMLIEALRRFRSRELGEAEVIDAVRDSRFLIPLLAKLGEDGKGIGENGLAIDKSQELAIVTVTAPDGRTVLPVFTSVAAMAAWNLSARPVPATAVRVALAAANENTDLVVVDPTSATEFVIRRPALWALAKSENWIPSYLDEVVLDEFVLGARPEASVRSVSIAAGDPDARLAGAELIVRLTIADGLDRENLDGMLERVQARWAQSEIIADRVDSITVQLASASG